MLCLITMRVGDATVIDYEVFLRFEVWHAKPFLPRMKEKVQ